MTTATDRIPSDVINVTVDAHQQTTANRYRDTEAGAGYTASAVGVYSADGGAGDARPSTLTD